MHRITSAIALTVVTTLASAADPTIEPGWYEVVTKVDTAAPSTEHRCVTGAEIAKGLQPESMPKECKVARSVLAGGKVDFAASCPDMTMSLVGTYTSTSYAMDSKLKLTANGKPIESASHVSAKKIATACKSE